MAGLEEISKRLFRQLDSLGYSRKMINIRRNVTRSMYKFHPELKGYRMIYSGSRGEGISKNLESDVDLLLYIPNTMTLSEKGQIDLQAIPVSMYVFLAESTSPGYCALDLLNKGTPLETNLENALVPLNGKYLLSSEVLKTDLEVDLKREMEGFTQMSGPATTSTNKFGMMSDTVPSIRCDCQNILKTWALRSRIHDWPSLGLRQDISKMYGNLVAVGRKDSPTDHLEWRYCFNEVEMKLIGSLNDTQVKMYKVLKIINNDLLKPSGFTISSYMVKNVVFWLAESQPLATFVPETLFQWVLEALKMLKQAVELNALQYYMIPGRNLMTEKVKETDRESLHKRLSELCELGPALLLQCKTLHLAMSLTVADLRILQNKVELLDMIGYYIEHRYTTRNTLSMDSRNDPLIFQLQQYMKEILCTGWPSLMQQEIDKCESWPETCKLFLE